MTAAGVLVILFGLIIISGGVLVWLSPVTSEVLTPAQDTLIDTADWMIKSCAGAIVGFAGGMRLANGRAAPVSSG